MLPLLGHHCNVFVSLLKEKKRRRKRQRKRKRKGRVMMMVATLPLTDGPTPPPATNFALTNISDSKISS